MSATIQDLSSLPESGASARCPVMLRVRGSSQDGREVRLYGSRISIGSAEGCTLRIRARGVRAVHCLLIRGRRRTIVRPAHPDTLLNSRSFSEAELRHGDLLQVGPVVLEYLDHPYTPSDGSSSTAVRDSTATTGRPEDGPGPADALACENAVKRREAALARQKEELDRLAEALRRREVELGLRERRLAEEEDRLSGRQQECLQSESDIRRAEQELTAQRKRLEERESKIVAQELELRRWEARIVEREAQLQRDQEELRRRVAEIAARERELSDWEEALRRKEQTTEVCRVPPAPTPESAAVSASVYCRRDGWDPFAPAESTRAAEVPGRDGPGKQFEDLQAGSEVDSHGGRFGGNDENSLISAKWLQREEQIGEPVGEALGPTTPPLDSVRESVGNSGTSVDSQQADDSASEDVESYMQSLLSRLRGRSDATNASRTATDPSAMQAESKGFQPVEETQSQMPGRAMRQRARQTPARERPQAAEKSVDFAAMRELAVLASQGAIDRYAKAKLGAAMRGKLAVIATALGCGLLLAALGWAGRLPDFGVYGIVAAAVTLLVYSLQYAILSGRLVVNPRGQLQLAERRISREMFKLQTGEKMPVADAIQSAPKPDTAVPDKPSTE